LYTKYGNKNDISNGEVPTKTHQHAQPTAISRTVSTSHTDT